MPALLTKMSSVPKASVVLATAARSSSAEALSAFRGNAFPPVDSISLTSWRALSGELEYVKATDAPSAASRRTMPAPMPLEPPVTRATLPLNDFVCIWPPKPPGHPLCQIMDCSVQNEHSAGAAHIRANGRNDKIICMGGTCAPLRGRLWRQGHGLSGFPSGISPAKSASRQRLSVTAGAFLGTTTDDPITSGLPVTWQQFCVGTSSPPPRGP